VTWDRLNACAQLAAGLLVLAWWVIRVVKALEWQDRYSDIDRSRQHKMSAGTWLKVKTISRVGAGPIMALGVAGTIAIVLATVHKPITTYSAAAAGLTIIGVRVARHPPKGLKELRDAAGGVIGTDATHQPPKVTQNGHHPEGGPQRITIPRPAGSDWSHWNDASRNELDRAVKATMPGDWKPVDWRLDGTSTWERQPELPQIAPYPGPGQFPDLGPLQIPVGVLGTGQPGILDLTVDPHTLLTGVTRAGKTSYLRAIALWLLHRGIPITALDINYAGLAFLEHRPGVTSAMDGFAAIAQAVTRERQRVEGRLAQLKRDRTYRRPHVIVVDELETLFDRARQTQSKPPGMLEPPLVTDIHEIARLAGKVNVHVILATQRPDSTVIPGSLRAQLRNRIAVGPMDEQAARMALDAQGEQATLTAAVKGRAVLRCGDLCEPVQGYWLADPDDTKHSAQDRAWADSLLPQRVETPPDEDIPTTDLGGFA